MAVDSIVHLLDKGEAIFADLCKAFDSLDHHIVTFTAIVRMM